MAFIDPTLLRARIPAIAEHIGALAFDLAACTPTPFDDLAASQITPIIESLLVRLVGTMNAGGPTMAGPDLEVVAEGHLKDAFGEQKISIKPETIRLLLGILKMFFPVLPFTAPPKAAAAPA